MTVIAIDGEIDRDFSADEVAPALGGEDVELHLDLDGYEGPIDVLLTLARDQKVDLKKISILELADQYLAFIARPAAARAAGRWRAERCRAGSRFGVPAAAPGSDAEGWARPDGAAPVWPRLLRPRRAGAGTDR
jgi:hypothetical protein